MMTAARRKSSDDAAQANSAVRNCRISHLILLTHLGLLMVALLRFGWPPTGTNNGGIEMSYKILHRVAAGVLAVALALSSPAFARGGGGGGGMMMGGGGGMHGGGMAGGHAMGGMGGGMHTMGGMGGGMHGMGGPHFAAMGVGGPHFSSGHFVGGHFTHAAFSPRFGFHHHFHHRFFFAGAPFFYAGYDNCWRRYWTAYGLQWVNVCGDSVY
jgi:hypothetical protein